MYVIILLFGLIAIATSFWLPFLMVDTGGNWRLNLGFALLLGVANGFYVWILLTQVEIPQNQAIAGGVSALVLTAVYAVIAFGLLLMKEKNLAN